MNETELRNICKVTGWQISWDDDYFNEERFIEDIIYDFFWEQNCGFNMDWRYTASDVLEGLERCVPLNITLEETFTLSTLKPFNQEEVRYRTVVLRSGDREKTVIYSIDVDEDAGFLAQQILEFAGVKDKKVVDVSISGEDYYAFAIVNSNVTPRDLEPFEFHEIALRSKSEALAATAQQTPRKYFYLPVLTSNMTEVPGDNQRGTVDVLTYRSDETFQIDYYASRVLQGQTLIEAVKYDLARDFNYRGDFKISDLRILDSAKDKQGKDITRLMVNVGLDHFDTGGRHVLGADVMWQTFPLENFARQLNLGFNLREKVIEEP